MSLSFLLLLLLFLVESPKLDAAATATGDVAALADLKDAVSPSSIGSWSCLASWNFSSDPCRPADRSHFVCGLSCTADSRVAAVALDAAGYSAAAIPASLSRLTQLAVLDLTGNAFRGPIPAALFSLRRLRTLALSSNDLTGGVSDAVTNLAGLESLDLSRNALTGPLPRSLASMLALRTLDLSFNRLTGALPASLPPNLVQLAIRGNAISGQLRKSSFEPLKFLEVAELAANRLDGKLEGWFFQLPSLQQVDLANNSLSGIEVSGGGGGRQLVAVDLGFNRIEGELPAGLAAYPALASLSVRHNRFRGPIPWEYSGAAFRRLFLDGNFLKGKVPSELLQGGGEGVTGSLGDNCLEGCLESLPMCSPVQKSVSVCRQAYRAAGGGSLPSLVE